MCNDNGGYFYVKFIYVNGFKVKTKACVNFK